MKGYNNFMSKKAFHPGSFANQKRVREAEEKTEAKRKLDEERLAQYQKEQELFNQKSLVSKISKDRLSVSFIYDAPAGIKVQETEKQSDKVQWTGAGGSRSKLNIDDDESKICLEWKRDRPMRPKKETIKQEPGQNPKQELQCDSKMDIKLKRELPDKVKVETDLKRIKKEKN